MPYNAIQIIGIHDAIYGLQNTLTSVYFIVILFL